MAVEDGAVLGRLLGLFSRSRSQSKSVPSILRVYEGIRKDRTTLNVKGAIHNRELYHMVDGTPECVRRNELCRANDWDDETSTFPWGYGNLSYLKDLLGFDAIQSAEDAFAQSELDSGIRP